MKKIFIWIITIFVIVVAGYMLSQSSSYLSQVEQVNSSGKALIGGPFTLVNQEGETVTEAQFNGVHTLVFFGFTHCPAICPTGLGVISNVLELLGEQANKIVPIFITVDPERDTSEVMKSYLNNFHSSFVGLTGNREQVDAVLRAYRVYAKKVEMTGDMPGMEGDYMMDHSTFIYLMDPKGMYLTHFSHNADPQDVVDKIHHVIQ